MKVGDIVECSLPGTPGEKAGIGVIVKMITGDHPHREYRHGARADVLTSTGVHRWWTKNLRVVESNCKKER